MTWNELMISIAMALVPVVAALVGGLVSVFISWLRTKIKNEKYHTYLDLFESISHNVVSDLEHTVVEGMKAASKDGKLTREEIIEIKDMAADKITSQLPNEAMKFYELAEADIYSMIGSMIEKYVHDH